MFSRLLPLANNTKRGDWRLFLLPFLLTLFGLLMIYEASSVMAIEVFANPLYFFERQTLWFCIAIIAFLIFGRINHVYFKKFALILFIANSILLILVLIPGIGIEILGGRRWLSVAGMNFQPSEMMKISLSVYLASLLTETSKKWVVGLVIALVAGLVILEPDMGTMLVITGVASIIYFVSGITKKEIVQYVFVCLFIVLALIIVSPYRLSRLTTYLKPSTDSLGASYHSKQIQIALGNGGWFGRGLGMSRQKYLYIPEVTTDSIFAVVAEEFGYIGVVSIIVIYGYYFYLCFHQLYRQKNRYSTLLGIGLVSSIALQFLMNLGAVSVMIPLTGVPLPFISYGGTALLINFICAGIIYNISKSNT